jgi:hypothetical protein
VRREVDDKIKKALDNPLANWSNLVK